MKRLSAIALTALAVALPAVADGVYRCGNNYSPQPCLGGTQVEVPPAPGAKEQESTRRATRQDAKTADAMEKARLKEEAKPVSVYIPPPKKEAASQPKGPRKKKSKKEPEYFTAVDPVEKKAK